MHWRYNELILMVQRGAPPNASEERNVHAHTQTCFYAGARGLALAALRLTRPAYRGGGDPSLRKSPIRRRVAQALDARAIRVLRGKDRAAFHQRAARRASRRYVFLRRL